jgi:N-acetylmuramoyl-L-alanine amidase
MKIVISSGHGKYIRGAEGPEPWGLDEVDEARKVVNEAADIMAGLGVNVTVFHDDVSDDQDENLKRIVDFHNAQGSHDLDISVHFNSATFSGNNYTNNPVGCEVFYTSDSGEDWATAFVNEMCKASGLINRGPKETGNLYFLNKTAETAVLLEVCFVNSKADVEIYHEEFEEICKAIARVIDGEELPGVPDRPGLPEWPEIPEGALFTATGTSSTFGGPDDTGVSPSEGLAFIFEFDQAPHLFLKNQPSGTSGLARRLDPGTFYLACRWDYDVTSKDMLRESGQMAKVTAKKTGITRLAHPADWGPHEEDTGRAADLSPALMESLDISTDDIVEVVYPWPA